MKFLQIRKNVIFWTDNLESLVQKLHNHMTRKIEQAQVLLQVEEVTNKNQSFSGNSHESATLEPDDTLEDLLRDAGEMLGQFGLSFRDPLEIFVDWARQIFQEVTESFEDNADYRTSTESSNHKTQTKSYTDKDPLDNIEAELKRLKKQQVKATSKSAFSVRSNIKDTDIEQELRSIKKKYKL